ncbi:MAG: hypothetical protein IT445_16255 [Phycisphaeraceae bacterium]|nr:hypothetical protein [Phycisphaeraceae bacterium]
MIIALFVSALVLAVPPGRADITTTGDVTPDPNTTTSSDDLYIGNTADGSMFIDDGSEVDSSYAFIGNYFDAAGAATVDGAGSTWTASGPMYVGYEGNGELTIINRGAVNSRGYIGARRDSAGLATVDGAGSTWNSSSMAVGLEGDGLLDITNGGTVNNGGYGFIGWKQGSTGLLTIDGTGSALTSHAMDVGAEGNGELKVTNGGTVNISAWGHIGARRDSTGLVTVDGTDSTWTSGSLIIGYEGNGDLKITNGGTVSSGGSSITSRQNSTGSVTVDGAGSTWTSGDMSIGGAGEGKLEITNGGAVNSISGQISYYSESTGLVTVDGPGSTWALASDLIISRYGQASLTITNGGQVNNRSARIATLGGSAIVTVDGHGSTWINSSSVYVQGSLVVSNGGSVIASSLNINYGTLSGDGNVIAEMVSNSGYICPGQTVGTLHLDGNLTQEAFGTLAIELADTAHDQLAVIGNVALAGTLALELLDAYIPNLGDTFTILTANSIAGTFATVTGVTISDHLSLAVTYADTAVTVTAALPGDAGLDGMVNLPDLQILGDHWQSTTATWATGDFTGDGVVNLADLQIIGDNWGYGTSSDLPFDDALPLAGLPGAGVGVPEPVSAGLLGMGLLVVILRHRAKR